MKKLVKDRRGMELAIGTLVIIILSIFVLIALLFIWNQQTGIFSDFLKNIAGESNVDAVVVACNSLVTRNSVYEYCCTKREVKLEDESLELTCQELSEKEFGSRVNKLNCESVC